MAGTTVLVACIAALMNLLSVSAAIIPLRKSLPNDNLPEQIHLSWTGDPTQMFVTWATARESNVTNVRYGLEDKNLTTIITGSSTLFVDGAVAHKQRFIHRAVIKDLVPGTRYSYQCGSNGGWGTVYSFRSVKDGTHWSPRLLVYGDMGAKNARSLSQMIQEVQDDRYDLVLHVGDFAYDLDNQNGDVGDDFLRALEPLAAIIPYMVVVGNHEEKFNFSHYRNRFTTPGESDGMYYSFNVGPLHITVISTEFYFFPRYGIQQIYQQFYWMADDLTAAAADPNNGWIFVAGHRPMYCSNPDIVDCNPRGNIFRRGIPLFMIPGLEDLMHDSGVDIGIWAHEHSYERTWPVYNLAVLNGSLNEPYTDPKGIVHIITGSAGCKENHTQFNPKPPNYSAFRTTDYGYTRMTIFNRTHVYFEQVSDDKEYIVVDSVWIRKTQPGRPVWYKAQPPRRHKYSLLKTVFGYVTEEIRGFSRCGFLLLFNLILRNLNVLGLNI